MRGEKGSLEQSVISCKCTYPTASKRSTCICISRWRFCELLQHYAVLECIMCIIHCMGCSKCYWRTSRCHKINKSIFKKVIPLIRVSILTFISNVCRNLYCIRSQAFVSMIKVHLIVLYNHGVNFIADIHTCTCVINLIKYTKWIVLLSMCNLLYG